MVEYCKHCGAKQEQDSKQEEPQSESKDVKKVALESLLKSLSPTSK